ncbi:FecR family protein [Confluentibacter sediminis]|uniref:FecR family protein n=1 Tax=Confluentibacter sediminis TaxID=2219045 RepID=UPI000DAF45E1|nr:FecR family protein [Confluentibacter sediminis]
MPIFNKIIVLSKQIAASLLKGELPTDLDNFEIFDKKDKQYILKNLTDESLIKRRKNLTNQINKQADLEKVQNKITIPVRKISWKYAAAAAVLGILTTSYFFKDNLFPPTKGISKIVDSKIETGTDKAILTLEDGSTVALGKSTTYQKNNISSNGEKLVYNPSEKSKNKIKYNYLTIPRGGKFSIKLSDGTQVWLNSESQLKYPVVFVEGDIREVELVYGEAYFDVSPSTKHNGAKFRVINKDQEVEVIGTEFNIKAYKDDTDTYTTLVKGKVALSYEGKKQNLLPNQQSHLDFKTNTLALKTVDVYNEISWKEGVFSFENKSLKEIMKVLARWYDIEVFFENQKSENVEFNGILDKNQNIEEILIIIKNFKIIKDYKINNKTVLLK